MPLTKIFGIMIAQKIFDVVRPFVFKLHTLAFNKVCKKFRHPLLGYDEGVSFKPYFHRPSFMVGKSTVPSMVGYLAIR